MEVRVTNVVSALENGWLVGRRRLPAVSTEAIAEVHRRFSTQFAVLNDAIGVTCARHAL